MMAKYNVEGKYGTAAAKTWLDTILGDSQSVVQDDVAVKLHSPPQEMKDAALKVMKMMGAVKETKEGPKTETQMPVRQFLNRVLNLTTSVQRQAFDHFMSIFDANVNGVKAEGRFDEGSTELKAENPRVVNRETFHVADDKTPTHHLTVEADFPVEKNAWERAYSHMRYGEVAHQSGDCRGLEEQPNG